MILAGGAGLTNVPYLAALVAFRGLGLSGGSRDSPVLVAGRGSRREDDVGEDWGGGLGTTARVPHFLTNEAGQGLVEVVVFHPLEEDLGDLAFFVGPFLGDAGVDLSVVPVEEKLRGGLVPTVLKGVDHRSIVVVVADPLEHVSSGGILDEGFFAPLSKGGRGLSCRCDLDTVEGDGFGEDPLIPRVGTSGGGGAVSGGGHASSREEGEVGCLVAGSLEVFFCSEFSNQFIERFYTLQSWCRFLYSSRISSPPSSKSVEGCHVASVIG